MAAAPPKIQWPHVRGGGQSQGKRVWGDRANKWKPSSPLTVSSPSGLILPTETPSFPLLQFPRPWPKQEPLEQKIYAPQLVLGSQTLELGGEHPTVGGSKGPQDASCPHLPLCGGTHRSTGTHPNCRHWSASRPPCTLITPLHSSPELCGWALPTPHVHSLRVLFIASKSPNI